jgi:putative membrane protein
MTVVLNCGLYLRSANAGSLRHDKMADANSLDAGRRLQLERLSGPLGRYDGLALILLGIGLVVVAATRFVRTGQLLDDQEMHPVGGVRAELLLSAALALIVAGFSTYLLLG